MSVAGLGVYGMPEAMAGNVARPNFVSCVCEDVIEFGGRMHLESNECSTGWYETSGRMRSRGQSLLVRGRGDGFVTNLFREL